MSAYKEYGGFLEMETRHGAMYHVNAKYLNSARNALKYIIRLHQIKKIAVSYFTCPVIWQAIQEEKCEMVFFDIDKNMNPQLEHIGNDEFILCNNYFGIKSKKIRMLVKQHPNLIVDNAQAFYSPAYGMASFYSPRKFFGLPDGGIAITSQSLDEIFNTDTSYQRCAHLLKRHDLGASAAYQDFCNADRELNDPEIKFMSNLTKNLMRGIDYGYAKTRRRENFTLIHHHLSAVNMLSIDLTDEDVPMAYPLLIECSHAKAQLISKKIYVPTYWPQLEDYCPEDSNALYVKNNLIPLPLDQRYTDDDIRAMLKIIQSVLMRE